MGSSAFSFSAVLFEQKMTGNPEDPQCAWDVNSQNEGTGKIAQVCKFLGTMLLSSTRHEKKSWS